MKPESQSAELRQLVKDARKAIWAFAIVNLVVLFLFILDGIFNEVVFILLFVQLFLLVFWLLPVFCYQLIFKRARFKYAVYSALVSYKEALGHVSW